MPEQYTAMKQKFMKQGLSEDRAQKKAAKIYNEQHPNDPVQPGKYEKEQQNKGSKKKGGSKSKKKDKKSKPKEQKVREGMKKAFPKDY